MRSQLFSIETVSPLFLAGANSCTAEIFRPPSIRGAMRYWYRALLGGIMGPDKLASIKQHENDLFGTTDLASALQVFHQETQTWKDVSSFFSGEGLQYLFWSSSMSKNQRRYIPEKQCFPLTLAIREHTDRQLDKLLAKGIAAFWLLTQLGGIGTRSRRGAGSLKAVPLPESQSIIEGFDFSAPRSCDVLSAQIRQGIRQARKLFEIPMPALTSTSFDTISSNVCSIWVLQCADGPWNTWQCALNDLGIKLKQFHQALKRLDTPYKALLGLPHPDLKGWKPERLASPLMFHLTQLADGNYVVVATLFKTSWMLEYLPGNKQGHSERYHIQAADYAGIERWIERTFEYKKVAL